MGAILKNTAGVIGYEIPREGIVVVTFDDRITTVQKITKALEEGRFSVNGKPEYVTPGKKVPYS